PAPTVPKPPVTRMFISASNPGSLKPGARSETAGRVAARGQARPAVFGLAFPHPLPLDPADDAGHALFERDARLPVRLRPQQRRVEHVDRHVEAARRRVSDFGKAPQLTLQDGDDITHRMPPAARDVEDAPRPRVSDEP